MPTLEKWNLKKKERGYRTENAPFNSGQHPEREAARKDRVPWRRSIAPTPENSRVVQDALPWSHCTDPVQREAHGNKRRDLGDKGEKGYRVEEDQEKVALKDGERKDGEREGRLTKIGTEEGFDVRIGEKKSAQCQASMEMMWWRAAARVSCNGQK